MKTVLICGSRGWQDRAPIEALLDELGTDVRIIHGGARGADLLAGAVALERGIDVISVEADWHRHGRAAGPIRNQSMLDLHHPVAVYAFRCIGKSNGTDDMCARARRAGIPTEVINS